MPIDTAAVETYLKQLQAQICSELEAADGVQTFRTDNWQRPEGGGGISRVLGDGAVFEKGGVNFSLIHGDKLPASATAARPQLSGAPFKAMGLSLVLHPANPFVPTTHANVRFFIAELPGQQPLWWFGGGYDLTPYYPFEADCISWHQTAKAACQPFGDGVYKDYKAWCDRYFYLPHRRETRGIGGLFFDDLNSGNFKRDFGLLQAVGNSFTAAYLPIVKRRKDTPYTDRHRQFQLYRRGRYVEFNLVYDRGTLFGLQSGGRAESVLMSLPPLLRFDYGFQPQPGSAEAELYENYLKPRDWV